HTDVLCAPEMTGEWESRLKQMAHGKLDRRHFMEDIRGLTRDIVERVRNFRGETIEGEYATIDAKCPNCGGGPIKEDYKTFRCQNCDWLMWKTMASRQFEPEEVHELLAKGRVGPLQGFRSKMGRPFEALVKLGAEKKPQFDFGENGLDAEQKIDTEKRKGRFRVRRKKGKAQEESCRAQSGRCVRRPSLRVARGRGVGRVPFAEANLRNVDLAH